ncbi:hypothetical protein RHGRI_019394 [Rhododendron griersonianum]|uniref:Uncharacterized protein n=1 Tax=Rhododendron griersonianum TaxID=479676 RepID=A0AAV6JFA5_9ERIC|nr:hypothetical protein RHGRI_019394 [Rhododendron griersonianum]
MESGRREQCSEETSSRPLLLAAYESCIISESSSTLCDVVVRTDMLSNIQLTRAIEEFPKRMLHADGTPIAQATSVALPKVR